MDDMIRQRMIIRQNALNRACDLLMSEQEIAKSSAKIPLESIKNLTKELESFVWELDVPDNRHLNPNTGQVIQQQQVKQQMVL